MHILKYHTSNVLLNYAASHMYYKVAGSISYNHFLLQFAFLEVNKEADLLIWMKEVDMQF